MGLQGYLALWCGVFGTVALVGYARSLAGMTPAQRAVRVMGADRAGPGNQARKLAERRDTRGRLLPGPLHRAGVHRDERP
jgi:hypothetical protein